MVLLGNTLLLCLFLLSLLLCLFLLLLLLLLLRVEGLRAAFLQLYVLANYYNNNYETGWVNPLHFLTLHSTTA